MVQNYISFYNVWWRTHSTGISRIGYGLSGAFTLPVHVEWTSDWRRLRPSLLAAADSAVTTLSRGLTTLIPINKEINNENNIVCFTLFVCTCVLLVRFSQAMNNFTWRSFQQREKQWLLLFVSTLKIGVPFVLRGC